MGLPKGLNIKVGHSVSNRPTVVTLYQTEIVTIHHDSNRLILRNGGWQTVHTKKCMNLILKDFGIIVRQIKGNWFVSQNEKQIPFQDGMEISI